MASGREAPLIIEGERLSADDCFARSLEIWDDVAVGVAFERARTLRDWAAHARATGDAQSGQQMQQRAAAIFADLRMVGELSRLEIE